MEFDVKVEKGWCTGRNGTFEIGSVVVTADGSGMVRIGCVSKGLKRNLNAGFEISVAALDSLAAQWQASRSGIKSIKASRISALRKCLVDALHELDMIREEDL